MKKVLVLALAALSLVAVVAAADPAGVASEAAETGYVIEPGADATDDVVGRAVSDARSAGSRFFVVVLAEEPASGATFFADAVLDRLPGQEGTVLVVAPETVGWASGNDVWTTEQLNAALDASLDGATSGDVVTIFVAELINPSTSGGSAGFWFLVIAVIVIGVIGFLVWRSRRSARDRAERALERMKAETQVRIDALANDILDDEDEIARSGNEEAARRFDQATAIYADVADELRRAQTPPEVVVVANQVDEAIWHLDCAEAILDGQPLPPEPEPPKLEPAAPRPATVDRGVPPTTAAPLPQYRRRSTRRSSYGAGDMMKTMLAMQAMRTMSRGGFGGGSRSGGRSSSRSSGGSRSSSRSSGRSRGGGRRRG